MSWSDEVLGTHRLARPVGTSAVQEVEVPDDISLPALQAQCGMKGLRHLEFPIPVVHGLEIIGEHRCRRAGGLETVIGECGNPHDMDGDVSSADLPRGGHDDAQSIETHRTARRDEKDRGTPTVELKAAGRDEWCSITSSRPVSCSALSRQLLPRGDLKSRTVGGKPLGSPATSSDFAEHIFDQLAWRG
jgi:hypothetical protein